MNKAGGAGSMMFNLGKSNAKIYVKSSDGIRFTDVEGVDEAEENLQEIVEYLHDPKKYSDIGVIMAFPSLLLAMVVAYTIGNGLLTIFIALSFVSWAGTARVVRSEVLSLREKEYVEAATSIGVKRSVIMFRHIFPNTVPTLIVLLTSHIPGNILTESSLSFLGVGAQPPSTSWGLLVYQMKAYLQITPVATLAPGLAILILVVAFNFFGDAVRDKLDPKLQEQ
ncbi:MAG: ABC transporter permease subunit, partial [Eubacterium sp.]|nr:ABC transporter permease subunit [Eubacterium sp.]